MVESDAPPESWFDDLLSRSWLAQQFARKVWHPVIERMDIALGRLLGPGAPPDSAAKGRPSALAILIGVLAVAAVAYLGAQAAALLVTLPVAEWGRITQGLLATLLRVAISLLIAVAWTIPVGVWIGSNRRLANVLQPMVQIIASIPATALFPVIVVALIDVTGGLDVPAVLLMLLGTQWYMLFNVVAGASAIPQDLVYTTALLQVKGWARWRTLILPALFPYLITGMITASGGAWNASIVAEYINFGGQAYSATGVGALITEATARGDYTLLMASTLALILTVVTINRVFWRRLYRIAEVRYRME